MAEVRKETGQAMMALPAVLLSPSTLFFWYDTVRKPWGVSRMLEASSSSSCTAWTCTSDAACPWVPKDSISTLVHLQKDSFLPLGLWNNCRPRSCICLRGTSLLTSLKLKEAQVDTSISSNSRALGPGHQEGVGSNRDSSCRKSVELKPALRSGA